MIKQGKPFAEKPKPLESILEEHLKVQEFKTPHGIFASRAGLCERQTAGSVLFGSGIDLGTRKASSAFYFKIGSAFEDVVEKAFLNAGILLEREMRIESYHPELNVSGRIDFVIAGETEPLLVELKTCGKLPEKPKAPHLAQLQVYLVLTGMEKGVVWYISRSVSDYSGDLKQRAFEITLSEKERAKVLNKMVLGQLYANENSLPPIPKGMKKYKCGFCPLVPVCWDGATPESIGLEIEPEPKDLVSLLESAERICKEFIAHSPRLRLEFLKVLSGHQP